MREGEDFVTPQYRKQASPITIAKFVLIIITVVALGVFGVNQYMKLKYNAYLLTLPCDLCKELNPHLDLCPKQPIVYREPEFEKINITKFNEYVITDP